MPRRHLELCLASPVLYPPRGGAETRFLNYLEGLSQRGINVRLLTGTPKAKKITGQDRAQDWYRSSPGTIIPTAPVNGAPVHRVRLPDKSGWRRVVMFNQALLRYCREAESRPEVIQLIEPLSPLSTPWLFSLKTLKIATAFAYTLPYELPGKSSGQVLQRLALRLLFRQLDCVVTGSVVTRDLAMGLGIDNRIEVIPNGVNLQRFHPLPEEAKKAVRKSLGLPGNARVVTTVGSIIPRKGIDLLLKSWIVLAGKFPQLHLVLVGPRTDQSDPKLIAFHRELVNLVEASGAGDRVHFTGRVPNVEAYLQASDLFVFTSEREGMANVVLEAMASGLPVVMTPHIGLPPDFGEPGRHYLLAERNHEALATAVAGLLGDEGSCLELARHGRSWVEKTMDLDGVLDRYAAMYRDLAPR